MPNPEFTGFHKDLKGRSKQPPATGKRKSGGDGFPMKPAFKTGSFGKKQPSDRSGGVTRAKIYPNSDGL